MRRGWAITLVFFFVIALFAVLVLALVPPLVSQATDLIDNAPQLIQQLKQDETVQELDARFDIVSKLQDAVSGNGLSQAFGGILGVGAKVLGAVFSGITVLVLTLYFLGSFRSIKETGYRMVPASRRSRVRELGDRIIASVGGFVAGQAAIGATAGASTYLFLTIFTKIADAPSLGRYTLALALVVSVLDLVPLVGALVGAAVVTLVGLVDAPSVALVCVIFFVIYQQVENYVVAPRVFRRSVDLPPMVTIVAALIGGTLLGVVGALVAIPSAAAVVLIVREVVIPRQDTH
jgi:predicted PurR-regulated permease PerM